MANTTKGFPYPIDTDAADVPSDVQLLAEAIDAAPGIASLTQAQIDALSATQKWAGRIVWNQTTSKLQRSDGSTFSDIAQVSQIPLTSSATPASTAATGSAGSSADVSKSDHAHALHAHKSTHATGGTDALIPSDIGAIPASIVDAKGDLLVASGDNTVVRIPVGADGRVLTADSNQSSGVKWDTPSSAGASLSDLFLLMGA